MSNNDMSNSNVSNNDRLHDDPWDACPTGELTQMVHRLDTSQRRARTKQVYKTALVSTAVFACVVLALGSIAGLRGPQYGGISCSFCRGHLAEYHPHAAGELVHQDADFVASMKTHLEKCRLCRGKFNAKYPELSIAGAAATRPLLESARLPMFAMSQRVSLY